MPHARTPSKQGTPPPPALLFLQAQRRYEARSALEHYGCSDDRVVASPATQIKPGSLVSRVVKHTYNVALEASTCRRRNGLGAEPSVCRTASGDTAGTVRKLALRLRRGYALHKNRRRVWDVERVNRLLEAGPEAAPTPALPTHLCAAMHIPTALQTVRDFSWGSNTNLR